MNKVAFIISVLTLFASVANAQTLVRDTEALERLEIQGVSLSMTAEQAFDALKRAGFKAGDIDTYADWTTDGIEFVRGTYGSPEGHSSLTLSRRGERIVQISETYNAPGSPLDADAEIGAVKAQLGLPGDSTRCQTNSANAGTCQVQDAEASESVTITYTLQVLSTMRLVGITRSKELR